MFDGYTTLISWFARLFNPPPLASLTQGQKIVRSFLVAFTLMICCLAAAAIGALGLLLASHASAWAQDRAAVAGMEIVLVGILVNALCLRTVLAIKRAS